jgi:hypothetical protein
MSSSLIVPAGGKKTVNLITSDKIAVFCRGTCLVYTNIGFPQFPDKVSLLSDVTAEEWVSSAVSVATELILDNSGSAFPAYYEIGTDAVVKDDGRKTAVIQSAPIALNATGSLTPAMLFGGIISSTSAAIVAASLPTGAVLDAAGEFAIGDSIDWSVINTGPSAFNITASSGHTIGLGVVACATVTSARWRSRKTAANTFVSDRLS